MAPKPQAPEHRHVSVTEAVVYVAAIAAATIVACRYPDHVMWCLAMIAVLGGVKLADIIAIKNGRPPGGVGGAGTMAVLTFAAMAVLAGCL